MRSWISATSSLASVVMIAKVRIHSPEAGSFQFSQMPPSPNERLLELISVPSSWDCVTAAAPRAAMPN